MKGVSVDLTPGGCAERAEIRIPARCGFRSGEAQIGRCPFIRQNLVERANIDTALQYPVHRDIPIYGASTREMYDGDYPCD